MTRLWQAAAGPLDESKALFLDWTGARIFDVKVPAVWV
jgi:hypothetical protein